MLDLFQSPPRHWYQTRGQRDREFATLQSLGLTPERDEEDRLIVRDPVCDGLELEMVYPPRFPLEPPRVYVRHCAYPEALWELVETARLVTADPQDNFEVRYTRLHGWKPHLTGAMALTWARDIILVAVRLLPSSVLPSEESAPPPTRTSAPAASYESNDAEGVTPGPAAKPRRLASPRTAPDREYAVEPSEAGYADDRQEPVGDQEARVGEAENA